jgi:hypothetical protein
MFDELAILNGSRLMLLAGICYTLWSMSGVLWRGWNIGEVFFWMWWEIVLSGVSTVFLMHRWTRIVRPASATETFNTVCAAMGLALLAVVLASFFTLLALVGENIRLAGLPDYIVSRTTTMGILAALALAVHLMAGHGARFQQMTRQAIEKPLLNRALAVLGVYLVMICAYHWTGSTRWGNSTNNQLVMGCGLLGAKLLLELWQFFKARRPSGSGVLPRTV